MSLFSDRLQKLSRYEQAVPRYTSYPTAPHFVPMDSDLYRQWLMALPRHRPISVYTHIPFCPSLCWYCGCHTQITQRYSTLEHYIDTVATEMALVHQILESRLPCQQIHLGGGSPSYLEPAEFLRLMQAIDRSFQRSDSCQLALEIDPRHLTEAKVQAYRQAKVTRVSLGIQDFDPEVQSIIHRIQPVAMVEAAMALLTAYDFQDINFDLIYGLPGQTLASIEATLQSVLRLNPSRIALFGYAHVPWKKKHMAMISRHPLPDSQLRLEMFAYASQVLQEAGYVAIGLDHFARDDNALTQAFQQGQLQRNFQGYETHREVESILGFGISSISKLPQGYMQNTTDKQRYQQCVAQGQLPIAKGYRLTEHDRLCGTIIQQLMCYLTVDLSLMAQEFKIDGQCFESVVTQLIPLQQDGLLTIEGSRITVNPATRQAVRLVCALFDQYFQAKPEQHAHLS